MRSFEVVHQARAALSGIIVTKLNIILGNLRPRLQAPKNMPGPIRTGNNGREISVLTAEFQ